MGYGIPMWTFAKFLILGYRIREWNLQLSNFAWDTISDEWNLKLGAQIYRDMDEFCRHQVGYINYTRTWQNDARVPVFVRSRDELVILLITIELYSCTHTLSSHTDWDPLNNHLEPCKWSWSILQLAVWTALRCTIFWYRHSSFVWALASVCNEKMRHVAQ